MLVVSIVNCAVALRSTASGLLSTVGGLLVG